MPLLLGFPGFPIPGQNIQAFLTATTIRHGGWHRTQSAVKSFPVRQRRTEPACDHAQAQGAPARRVGRPLKRVFDIDIEHCPNRAELKDYRRHRRSAGDRQNPYDWACRPAPRRAPRRSKSIYSESQEPKTACQLSRRRRSL